MYTYIIIDDERLIRLGLISKIEEISSEKFECIGEAENGKKGMELLEEITPEYYYYRHENGKNGWCGISEKSS